MAPMSSTLTRLGLFAVALVAVFGLTFVGGRLLDPVYENAEPAGGQTMESMDPMDNGHGEREEEADGESHGQGHGDSGGVVPGLAVSTDGYTLMPESTALAAGEPQTFRFTINGPDGHAVTDFEPQHERELHLIIVPRDLSDFQHLHPTRAEDGTWSTKIKLPRAGTYRAYADFKPTEHEAGLTLGVDVTATGDYRPRQLPAPRTVAEVDDYTVEMSGSPTAGEETDLTFDVRHRGRPVDDLEPHLGAFGHLVTLRQGDLAYLHTHPHEDAKPGEQGGPGVPFTAEFATVGTYRVYFEFRHDGVVRHAAFTVTLDDHSHAEPTTPTASPTR